MIHCDVADDADIRRDNFKALMGTPFSPTDAATRLWGTAQQWSDLYYARKSFGEKLARRIEEKMGLVRLSLDDPGGPKSAPLSAEVLARISGLLPDERFNVENLVRMYLKMPLLERAAAPKVLPRKQARLIG